MMALLSSKVANAFAYAFLAGCYFAITFVMMMESEWLAMTACGALFAYCITLARVSWNRR